MLFFSICLFTYGLFLKALSSLLYHPHGFLSQQPLAFPLFGAQLWLTSTSRGSGEDYNQQKPPSLLSPAVLLVCFIYVVAFVELPWSIRCV